jgi:predicted  nucleic acid-binding Zn-ribbon protein
MYEQSLGAEGVAAFKDVVSSSASLAGLSEAKVAMESLNDQLSRSRQEAKRRDEALKLCQAQLGDAESRLTTCERDKKDLQLLVSALEKQVTDLVR